MNTSLQLAAIDLGSNSFRLEIGRADGGQIYVLDSLRSNVRLAAGLTPDKRLTTEAMDRGLEAISQFAQRLQGFDPSRIRAVGTNTLRVAKNAPEFIARMEAILGFPIEVIAGREEARLIFSGVAHSVPTPYGKRLVVDIGGGSTEFVTGRSTSEQAISIDIGCVRMTERHLKSDPPTPAEIAAAERDITAAVDIALAAVPGREAKTMLGLAGSVTTVTALALGLPTYDATAIHHARISYPEVAKVTADLLAATVAERRSLPVMHPGRADVIGAGALILRTIMERSAQPEVVASEHDILDGIAWGLA